MLLIFSIIILGSHSVLAADEPKYNRYLLYDLKPEFPWQLTKIAELKNNSEIMLWSAPTKVNRNVQVMTSPGFKKKFVDIMLKNRIEHQISIHNVQSAIQNQTLKNYKKTRKMEFDGYYDLGSIDYWYEDLKSLCPQMRIITIGNTVEGRPLNVVHLARGRDKRKYNKQSIFIEAGMNPRDWITTSTALYLIDQICSVRNEKTKSFLARFNWYIMPVANPDGYVYTFTDDRLWNKNRGIPHGVVLSRNWDFMWLAYGGETDVKSDIFAGTSSFSEPETRNLSNFLTEIKHDLGLYISLQSYGQMITIPYGYTERHLDNYETAYRVARAAIKKIVFFYGTEYMVGNPPEILSLISGTSQDWIKHNLKTPLVYTYYLRDNGNMGFLLPSDQIQPNCEEIAAGIFETLVVGEKFGVINYDSFAVKGQLAAPIVIIACLLFRSLV